MSFEIQVTKRPGEPGQTATVVRLSAVTRLVGLATAAALVAHG